MDSDNLGFANNMREQRKKSFVDKIFSWKFLAAFVALSGIIFTFMVLYRPGFSSADVKVFVQGPDSFKAQEKVEMEVGFVNDSSVDLGEGILYVTIPSFLKFDGADGVEQKIEFDKVKKGEKFSRKIVIISEDPEVSGAIKLKAEYSLENFARKLTSEYSRDFRVTSLPITVILNIPQKAVSGQSIKGSFDFVADSNIESGTVYAKLEFPQGFILGESVPLPIEENIWEFKDIMPGENYGVEFEGKIQGSQDEEKQFKLLFGKLEGGVVFTPQYETSKALIMASAPLELAQNINGKENQYSANSGEVLNFSIHYKNKSGVDIEDASLAVQLGGDIFDFGKVDGKTGYFNNNAKTITWNKNFQPNFALIKDGAEGEVSFSAPVRDGIVPLNVKDTNKSVKIIAVMESPKAPLSLGGLSLRAESQIEVKLKSVLGVKSKGYYYEGPFSNSGPVPPRVGEKTTYTIIWHISNTTNDASGVQVVAALPSYVNFENKIYPMSANLDYDSAIRTITWDQGSLRAGAGSILPEETVAFQISVSPEEHKRGRVIEIIGGAKIIGTDTFTGELLEAISAEIDTSLPDDVGVGDGVVQ